MHGDFKKSHADVMGFDLKRIHFIIEEIKPKGGLEMIIQATKIHIKYN